VGLDDNFFDLGGHSLLTIRMQSEIQDQLNVEIPLTAIFRYPTVRSLARLIAGEPSEGSTTDAHQHRVSRRLEAAQKQRRRRAR
jgi:hypothetical protein